jgi:hypothetical protein
VTTIAYQGSATSVENTHKIIAKVNDLSIALDWKIVKMEENTIEVTPHPKCESLSFVFDDKLKIEGFIKTVYASDADAEFWHVDMDNTDPFYESSLYLHAPTIRNRLGYDLSNGTRYAFVAEDLVKNLNKEGFLAYDTEFYQMYSYQYFRDLAKLWAWKILEGKPTNIKRNRCSDFSLALYNGIQGGKKMVLVVKIIEKPQLR